MHTSTISHKDVLEILNDFDWHHRREFSALARHVAPELASRAYISAVPNKSKDYRRQQPPEVQVRLGRVRIIDVYLAHLKNQKYIEVIGAEAEKQIRLIRRVYIDHRGRLIADLMRCPCCDGKPVLTDVFNFEARQFRAECDNCHLQLIGGDKQSVVDAWNTRVAVTEPVVVKDTAEAESLRELNENLTRQCTELNASLSEAYAERDEAIAAMQQFAPIIVR